MAYRTIEERAGGPLTQYELLSKKINSMLHVSMPAIIKEVDYDRMVVSVQPSIMEKISNGDGTSKDVPFPIIEDVPLVYPSSSYFTIFFPVAKGDECLLIFADSCIDSWWQSGGIQSQFEARRHDLSDCFAIPAMMSQPMKVDVSSESNLVIQGADGSRKIEITPTTVLVNGVDVKNHKHTITISGTTYTTTSPV